MGYLNGPVWRNLSGNAGMRTMVHEDSNMVFLPTC